MGSGERGREGSKDGETVSAAACGENIYVKHESQFARDLLLKLVFVK